MKNMKKVIILIVLFSGFAVSSFAQTSAGANAAATIVTPISISKVTDLNFGNISLNPTSPGGTVYLAPSAAGTRTPSAGVSLPSVTGTVSAAKFGVGGEGTSTFSIGIPSSITINGPSSSTMSIVPESSPASTGTLVGGALDLYVGGTITVGSSQTLGAYTGTFAVTVNYN
jgi:hypothetical protein